jgi:quinol monooxygenase YgiN
MPVVLLHIRARFYLSIVKPIFLLVIKEDHKKEVKYMNKLQISARMKIRKGKLEGFKQQAAEIIRQTKEKDTGTLQYDWFLSNDECEIREVYESSEALAEHKHNLSEALRRLFEEFAYDHNVVIYGDPSPQLLEGARTMMPDVEIKVYTFLQGLE